MALCRDVLIMKLGEEQKKQNLAVYVVNKKGEKKKIIERNRERDRQRHTGSERQAKKREAKYRERKRQKEGREREGESEKMEEISVKERGGGLDRQKGSYGEETRTRGLQR